MVPPLKFQLKVVPGANEPEAEILAGVPTHTLKGIFRLAAAGLVMLTFATAG
jgi:hypothetical protein